MKLALTVLATSLLGLTALSAADIPPADYPLKTCPVSGEKLGEMGKPVKVTHEGTDVYLCCKNCLKDFNKEPAKYTAKVKAEQKK